MLILETYFIFSYAYISMTLFCESIPAVQQHLWAYSILAFICSTANISNSRCAWLCDKFAAKLAINQCTSAL